MRPRDGEKVTQKGKEANVFCKYFLVQKKKTQTIPAQNLSTPPYII